MESIEFIYYLQNLKNKLIGENYKIVRANSRFIHLKKNKKYCKAHLSNKKLKLEYCGNIVLFDLTDSNDLKSFNKFLIH